MEYCSHGDLHTYMADKGPIPPVDSKEFARQIIDALHQMHRNDFVHRDLKL